MKFLKKTTLIILGIAILCQIPFIYNHFKLGSLSKKIALLKEQRAAQPSNYRDLKGIIHVHTSLGGHSTGSFDELIMASRENGLDFVVMTEHSSALYDTSAMTLNGRHENTLFIGGNEVSTKDGDRFLVIPGNENIYKGNTAATEDFLSANKEKFIISAYPEKSRLWDGDFGGIEVFSLHTNAKNMNPFIFFLSAAWSYRSYPDLLLASFIKDPLKNLEQYDQLQKKKVLLAGSDAHSNIGYHLFGDDAGNKFLNAKFDDYSTVFKIVRTHILIKDGEPINEESIIKALRDGHAYTGFDVMGDTSGFSFSAGSSIMGDEANLSEGLNMQAQAPLPARFILYRNGEKIHEQAETTAINYQPKEAGNYRVVIYLDSLGAPFNSIPWIISNPIYLR